MNAAEVYEVIYRHRIICIVRGVGSDVIVDIAQALWAGGVKLMEITCNTPGVYEMITAVSRAMSGKMVIGAGTVISQASCKRVLAAGAEYIVAPDVNPEVIKHCVKHDIAVLPGAATATEILTAARCGATMVKIFPAAAIGTDYIKMLGGPIDNIDFVAVGGVRPGNVKGFLDAGCIGIGIGGSVIRDKYVKNKDWDAITRKAGEYVQAVRGS